MGEQNKGFTVSDRRHSTAGNAAPEQTATATVTEGAAPEGEPATSVQDLPAPTFIGLVVGLAAQGGGALSAAAGETSDRGSRLAEARHVIGMLEVLLEKTQGNLTADEQKALESVVYELRMAYLATAKGGPA